MPTPEKAKVALPLKFYTNTYLTMGRKFNKQLKLAPKTLTEQNYKLQSLMCLWVRVQTWNGERNIPVTTTLREQTTGGESKSPRPEEVEEMRRQKLKRDEMRSLRQAKAWPAMASETLKTNFFSSTGLAERLQNGVDNSIVGSKCTSKGTRAESRR